MLETWFVRETVVFLPVSFALTEPDEPVQVGFGAFRRVLYESSFFERLAELVCVLGVAERTGTHDCVTTDASSVLASYLDDRILSEFFERVFGVGYGVILGERV